MSNGTPNRLKLTKDQMFQNAQSLRHPGYDTPAVEGDLPFQPLVPEDKGLLRDMHQGDVRARNQPNNRAILNSIIQIGSTVIGDAVAGVGYLGEIGDINDIVSGKETEWGNWLTRLGESIKEKGEEIAPVYASQEALTTFAPWDGEWWASNIPSIGSTLALIVPAVGTVGLVSRFGKALGIAQKMSAETGQLLKGLGSAVISRHIENMMESKEVFDNSYELALSKGRTEEEARLIAGEAASNSYNTNYINLITDVPQYLGLLGVRLPGIPKAKNKLLRAGQVLGGGFAPEVAEEVIQFIIQQESERGAKTELGEEDDTTFGQRFVGYLQEPGLQTAGFFGGIGGTVFAGISKAFEKMADRANMPLEQARQEALKDVVSDAVEKEDFETPAKTINEMKADPALAENTKAQENLAKAEETLKHAEEVHNNLTNDPYQKEKTKLAAEAKILEQSLQQNQNTYTAIAANIENKDGLDYQFLKLQKEALKGDISPEAKAVRGQIDTELNSERFTEVVTTRTQYSPYSTQLKTLAAEKVRDMKAQEALSNEIEKYETPEGQEQLAKEEEKKIQQEQEKVINKAQEATTPEQITSLKQTNPELADKLDEVKQSKAAEQSKEAPGNWKDYTPENIDEFMKARYEGRPFLLEQDMNKTGVSSIGELQDYFFNNMTRELQPLAGKQVKYKGEVGTVKQDEGGKFTVETKDKIFEVPSELPASEISIFEVATSNKYTVEIIAQGKEARVNGNTYEIVTDAKGNISGLATPEGQVLHNEAMLIAVEIERNKQIHNDPDIDYSVVKEEIESLNYNELLDRIWSINLTDVVAQGLNKLYAEKPLTEKEQLQISLWLSDVYYRIEKIYLDTTSELYQEILLNATETVEIIHSLLYNLTGHEVKRKSTLETETQQPAQEEKAEASPQIKAAIKKRYEAPPEYTEKSFPTEEPTSPEPTTQEDFGLQPAKEAAPEQSAKIKGRRQKSERVLNNIREADNPIDKLNAIQDFNNNIDIAPNAATAEEKAEVRAIESALKDEGYEITDLKNKKFHPGMRMVVDEAIPDESLPDGTVIIDRIRKPQILKDDRMVQAAVVTTRVGYKKPPEPTTQGDFGLQPAKEIPSTQPVEQATEAPPVEPIAEEPLLDQLESEATARNAPEKVQESQEIEGYYEREPEVDDTVDGYSESDKIENPYLSITNDMALYQVINHPTKGKLVEFSGIGKQGQAIPLEQAKAKYRINENATTWSTLYDTSGNTVPSQWRQPDIPEDELRTAFQQGGLGPGSLVRFVVDTTAGVSEIFDYNGWKSLRILMQVVNQQGTLNVGMVKAFKDGLDYGTDSQDFQAFRKALYNEWVEAGKPAKFEFSKTGSLSEIYAGRYWNTPVRNNPKDVLASDEPFVLGVGVTEGEGGSVQYVDNNPGINIERSLREPRPGGVYQAVRAANGKFAWSRIFTKRLSDETARAKKGMFPTWEKFYGGFRDVSLDQVVMDLLGIAEQGKTSEEAAKFWKDNWPNIRRELQSIVRFNIISDDGKTKRHAPDFRDNLPEIFRKNNFTAQSYYDKYKFGERPIQINAQLVNKDFQELGPYNGLVSDRLETDINGPGPHTHSPKFSVKFPDMGAAKAKQPITRPKSLLEGDPEFRFSIDKGGEYEVWDEAKELEWFKTRFPNVPIRVYTSLKTIGGLRAHGAFHKAAGVLVSSSAKPGTAYHEAFHVAFNLGLTEAQRAKILAEASKTYGQKSDRELEEHLADAFQEYVQAQDTSLGSRIKRFFSRLLELIRFSLTNKLSIDYLFDRIEQGKYSGIKLGPKFETRYKLAEEFPNLAEQRQRLKEMMYLFDGVVQRVMEQKGIDDVKEAYNLILSNMDRVLRGDTWEGIPSILSTLQAQKQLDMSKQQQEKIDRFIAAIQSKSIDSVFRQKLGSRGIYLREATANAEDSELFDIGEEDFVESWQVSQFKISPLENLSGKLKRFLDNVPRYKMAKNSNGRYPVILSDIGIPQTHDGKFLYADLQSRIGTSVSVTDMTSKLDSLAEHMPHYDYIRRAVAAKPELATHLFAVAQKVHPEFFDIVNHKGVYSIKYSNTDSLPNSLLSEWYTGFSSHYENKYLNSKGEAIHKKELEKKWQELSNKASSQDVTSELHQLFLKLGINIPLDVLQAAYADNNLGGIASKFNAILAPFVNSNKTEISKENKSTRAFAQEVAKYYPVTYQSAHINVEGNRQYEWVNSSYMGKLVAKLKIPHLRDGIEQMLRKDLFYNELLDNGVLSLDRWSNARWGVVGGIKRSEKGRGTGFTSYSDKDTAITLLSMFKEGWHPVSVNSSSSPVLATVKIAKGYKDELSPDQALDKLFALANSEYARITNQENPGWKNYTPGKYAFFPELNPKSGVPGAPSRAKIAETMEQQLQELRSKLTGLKILEKGKLTFDKSLDADTFLRQFIYNFNLRQAEIIMMMQGDPSFYKNTEDFFKRAREVWSPGNYLDTKAQFVTQDGRVIKFHRDKYNMKVLADVEGKGPQFDEIRDNLTQSLKQTYGDTRTEGEVEGEATLIMKNYEDVNETDAQSYIDLYSYRLRLLGEGRWTQELQDAYDILIPGGNSRTVFQPIKPFYYSLQAYKALVYPMQNKDAEFLLVPQFANGNPKFEEMLLDMGYSKEGDAWSFDEAGRDNGQYTDKISFESAIKVQVKEPFRGETLDTAQPIEMHWESWRRQMETPEHYIDAATRFGTQVMKLITADLSDKAEFSDNRTGEDIKREYENLVIQDIIRSSDELMSRFAEMDKDGKLVSIDKEKFVQILREEVNQRQLGEQYLDALDMTYNEVLDEMDTALPLFHPLHSTRVESMISSLFKNNITKQKFANGVQLYNTSSYGLKRKPKIKFKDGSIEYVECYAPAYSKAFDKYRREDGTLHVEDVPEEMLEGLVYRIPTEDKYSMFNIRIIGFTNDSSGGAIILPPEITKIAGLDFDIDKTYGFFYSPVGEPNVEIREKEEELQALIDGELENNSLDSQEIALQKARAKHAALINEIEKLKKQDINEQAKRESDNAKLKLMKEVLQHPSMTKAFLQPGGFHTIKEITKTIRKWKGDTSQSASIINPNVIIDTIRRVNSGAALTGIAANYNASKARWQNYPMRLKNGYFLFEGETYDDLSAVDVVNVEDSDTAPRKVSKNIAEVLAAAVDNGKEPLAEYWNLNTYTADVAMSMLTTGVPLKSVMWFMSQPSIVKHTQEYFNLGGKEPQSGLAAIESPHNIIGKELREGLQKPNEEIQARMLQNFLYYKNLVKPVTELVSATKVPDAGAGPSIAHTVSRQRQYYTKLEDRIEGSSDFLRSNSFHNTFVQKGIDQALNVFTMLGFPSFTVNSGLKKVLDMVSGRVKTSDLTAEETNRVYQHYMEYLASAHPFFSATGARELHEGLHQKATAAKAKSNNLFLNRLEVTGNIINFRAVVSIHKEELNDYREAWAEMLKDQTEIEPGYTMSNLATDLVRYSFLRSGFNPQGFGNFAHLQPIEFYTQIPEGREFNNLIIRQVQAQNNVSDTKPYEAFVEQFVRNNFQRLYYIPEVEEADVVFKDGKPISLSEPQGQLDPKYKKFQGTLFKAIQGIYAPIPTLGIYEGEIQVMREYQFGEQQPDSEFIEPEPVAPIVYTEQPGNPSEYTNFSGAAKGADLYWAEIGKKYGISRTRHFTPSDYDGLNAEQKEETENAYKRAAAWLGRPVIEASDYVGKLMRRSYLQAKKGNAIFAISTIVEPAAKDSKGYANKAKHRVVAGGTGYAVVMAIQLGKPVYVFDQARNAWYTWNGKDFVETQTPQLTRNFAGIGTRELNAAGKEAIEQVYANTFATRPKTQYENIVPDNHAKVAEVNALEGKMPEVEQPADTGQVDQAQTLWLNYQDRIKAKKPGYTYEQLVKAIEKHGLDRVVEQLKCYDK